MLKLNSTSSGWELPDEEPVPDTKEFGEIGECGEGAANSDEVNTDSEAGETLGEN